MKCVADATASLYTHDILEFIMNERIKVLAEQAKFMAEETINKKISKNAELDAFAGTFAELLVKEMCGLMEQAEDDAYHCFEPAERPTEYIAWLDDWRAQFAKHFGVDK